MTQHVNTIIYHILPRADWVNAQAQGEYRPASLAGEGFIHLSTRDQVPGTLARFFPGHGGLLLLCVAVDRLQAELGYDAVGESAFPHLYGALNLDAISEVLEIKPGSLDPFSERRE